MNAREAAKDWKDEVVVPWFMTDFGTVSWKDGVKVNEWEKMRQE